MGHKDADFLQPGEQLFMSNPACKSVAGGLLWPTMGYLFLTNMRLVFKAHKIEFTLSDFREFPFSEITEVKKILLPRGSIRITLKDNSFTDFQLNGKQWKQFIEMTLQTVNNMTYGQPQQQPTQPQQQFNPAQTAAPFQTEQQRTHKFCVNCGEKILIDEAFCNECGTKQ